MAFSVDRFGATESGVDRRVLVIVSTLVLIASCLAIAVPGFGGAGVAGTVASTSQPAIFSCAEAGHECSKICHRLRLFLAEASGKPFVVDAMFKGH